MSLKGYKDLEVYQLSFRKEFKMIFSTYTLTLLILMKIVVRHQLYISLMRLRYAKDKPQANY